MYIEIRLSSTVFYQLSIVFTARVVATTTVSASSRVKQNGGAKPRISPCGIARAITLSYERRVAETCGRILFAA